MDLMKALKEQLSLIHISMKWCAGMNGRAAQSQSCMWEASAEALTAFPDSQPINW